MRILRDHDAGRPGAPRCRAIRERARGRTYEWRCPQDVRDGCTSRRTSSDAQPDTDAGHLVWVGRLKQVKAQMEQVAAVQRAGLIDVHTGAVEKRRLRREMLAGPISRLAGVGGLAGREHPDLVNKFRYKPSGTTYVAHRTASRSMQAEAETPTRRCCQNTVCLRRCWRCSGSCWTSSTRPWQSVRQRRTRGAQRGPPSGSRRSR